MSNQDKSKEATGNPLGTSILSSRDNFEGFHSSALNTPQSSILSFSKSAFSPFAAHKTPASSNTGSPLNINASGTFMGSPSILSPQAFSPSHLSNTFSGTNLHASSAVQKSLSALDVKAMTRDILMSGDNLSAEESWPSLVVRVLPLFNGERLGGHIEDLNEVVRACLRTVDVATFTKDINNDLLAAGMFTINAKLVGVHEDKVTSRLVELWSFFLGTVLPYLEGVFLPHQVDLLQSKRSHNLTTVRTMALTSFKEQVIVPFMDRLEASIHQLFKEEETAPTANDDTASKLLQMMSILNMTPPISNPNEQRQFDHISSLLRNRWKERIRKA